jgi:hypothetical protein
MTDSTTGGHFGGRPDVFRRLRDTGILCVALAKPFRLGRLVEEVDRLPSREVT